MRSLLQHHIDLGGLALDTAIAAYLLEPADARYDLGSVTEKYTGFAAPADDAVAAGQLDLGGTQIGDEAKAGREALAVSALAAPIGTALEQQGMARLYAEVENRSSVCSPAWSTPAWPSTAELQALNQRLTSEVARLGAELRALVGRDELNVNSTPQLREILFADPPLGRGLTPVKKTKTGPSTDAASLEKLHDQWPEFIGPLLQYRELEKLRGTYGEGLLAEVAADGRIHATFNQTVARTGRLSSDRPNLHNIPVRRERGGPSAPRSSRPTAGSYWWPTTTRSSCAASPTWRPTPV